MIAQRAVIAAAVVAVAAALAGARAARAQSFVQQVSEDPCEQALTFARHQTWVRPGSAAGISAKLEMA